MRTKGYSLGTQLLARHPVVLGKATDRTGIPESPRGRKANREPLHRTVSSKDCGQERCQDVLRTIQQVSDFIAKGKSISHIATICITILKKNYFCLQKHLKQCESL